MGMSHRGRSQDLLGNVHRRFQTNATSHSLVQCFVAKRENHNKPVFDNAGILDRQDVVMFQRCSGPNFLAKLRQNSLGVYFA